MVYRNLIALRKRGTFPLGRFLPAVARSLFADFLALWLSAHVRSPPAARRTRSYHQASDLILTYVDDDFEELSKGFVPPNTVADMRKCVRLFQDWAKDRNAPIPGDKVSHSLQTTTNCNTAKFQLSGVHLYQLHLPTAKGL